VPLFEKVTNTPTAVPSEIAPAEVQLAHFANCNPENPRLCLNGVMRIALVGPELEENLSLRYLRGALEKAGREVVQIDFNYPADLERTAHELVQSGAQIAGLSMVFTARARQFVALAARARELGFAGHVVAGGHFAAFNAEALLHDVPAIDSVACGEGEAIMCDLACQVGNLARVPGLIWRDRTGTITRNPAACIAPDLDGLPWPVRRFPPDDYLGLPVVSMLQSRGCEHSCGFCSIAAWHRLCGGPRYRAREVEAVAAEMEALYAEGFRIFNFHDDNFLPRDGQQRLERVRALRQALSRRRLGRIAFAIKARPDEVDEEIFSLLISLGLFRVFLGIEAGTADSLQRLGRGQTVSHNERALDVVNRLGLHTCFNLLLLNPDSTLEDLAANVAFLRRRPHNPMNFCRTEIYAGTPLEQKLRRQGRLRGDYFGYDYRIADPRVQAACEIIYQLFLTRNWDRRGLHPLVMHVDYENSLLVHFYESGQSGALTHEVKSFIERANLNSAGYLDEVVAMATQAREGERARLVDDAATRLRADEATLAAAGEALLQRIRKRAQLLAQRRRPGKHAGRTLAAAAGLAATVAVASSGCNSSRGDPTHFSEMIAAPHQPRPAPPDALPATAPPADAAVAPTPPARPAGDEAFRLHISRRVLAIAAPAMSQPGPLRVELAFDKSGKVKSVTVSVPAGDAKAIERRLRHLQAQPKGKKSTSAPPPAAGHRFTFSFSTAEVTAARPAPAPKPMLPRPPPRHDYNEMAPFWPRE